MFARQLAVFCLLLAGTFPARAQSGGSSDPEVVVYLGTGTNQAAPPLKYMRRELVDLMRQAGYLLELRDLRDREDSGAAFLSVVELNGTCAMPPGYPPADTATPRGTALASTAITDGRVLPFSTVNCTALTHFLQPALSKEPGAQRDYLYGRALARVVAHELYHAMAQTTGHAHSGVAKSALTPAELLAGSFTFENPLPSSTSRPVIAPSVPDNADTPAPIVR